MSKDQEKSIREMISSSDRQSVYMAACMLRKDTARFTQATKTRMLKSIPLEDRIRDYADICDEMQEKQLTLENFDFLPEGRREKALASAMLNQIASFLNGPWVPDWGDYNQEKWFPLFDITGRGLVFRGSGDRGRPFGGLVAFKDKNSSDFVGKNFSYLYEKLM